MTQACGRARAAHHPGLGAIAGAVAGARGVNISLAYAEIARRKPTETSAEWAQLFAQNQIPAMPLRDRAMTGIGRKLRNIDRCIYKLLAAKS